MAGPAVRQIGSGRRWKGRGESPRENHERQRLVVPFGGRCTRILPSGIDRIVAADADLSRHFLYAAMPSRISLRAASMPSQPSTLTHLPASRSL